jgi:uncharacterized protein (TIGR02118 family)
MVTRITFLKKHPGMSRIQLADLWTGAHSEIAMRLPGLRDYTIFVLDDLAEGAPPYDGVAVVQFDSLEVLERAFATPDVARGLRATRDDFASEADAYLCTQHVMVRDGERCQR